MRNRQNYAVSIHLKLQMNSNSDVVIMFATVWLTPDTHIVIPDTKHTTVAITGGIKRRSPWH